MNSLYHGGECEWRDEQETRRPLKRRRQALDSSIHHEFRRVLEQQRPNLYTSQHAGMAQRVPGRVVVVLR